MKFKVDLLVFFLYLGAFSNILIQWAGVGREFNSLIFLILDLGIIFLGLEFLKSSILNLIFLGSIFIISLLNYLANDYAMISLLNGLRELLNLALIFSFYEAVCRSKYKAVMSQRVKRFMYVFLTLQIPISIFQFIKHGASDEVGGSLGFGNSGILTLLTVLMVYLLIKQAMPTSGSKAYFNAIFLVPTLLNETKISFILIPMMFLCLMDFRKGTTAFVTVFIGLACLFFLNSFYSNKGRNVDNPFEQIFNQEYLEYYLFSEVELGADVPRIKKITMASEILEESIPRFLFGLESGAFKGGAIIESSDFAKKNNWLLLGSRPYIFYLLVSGGWMLLIAFLVYSFKKMSFYREKYSDSRFRLLLIGVFCIILFYNDAFRNQFFLLNYAYLVLVSNGLFAVDSGGNA